VKAPIVQGAWYLTRPSGTGPRWVLALTATHVIYSKGGDRHYECQVRTFKSWIKRENALVKAIPVLTSVGGSADNQDAQKESNV
jgi:hypothetical protein